MVFDESEGERPQPLCRAPNLRGHTNEGRPSPGPPRSQRRAGWAVLNRLRGEQLSLISRWASHRDTGDHRATPPPRCPGCWGAAGGSPRPRGAGGRIQLGSCPGSAPSAWPGRSDRGGRSDLGLQGEGAQPASWPSATSSNLAVTGRNGGSHLRHCFPLQFFSGTVVRETGKRRCGRGDKSGHIASRGSRPRAGVLTSHLSSALSQAESWKPPPGADSPGRSDTVCAETRKQTPREPGRGRRGGGDTKKGEQGVRNRP